jgi:serine/threonine-protein kinase
MKLAPGDVIAGRYRVRRVIGEGGVGVVAAAEHLVLREEVALKALKRDTDDAERSRLVREARAVARLRSPHVVRVQDVLFVEGQPVLVMELVAGESLAAVIKRGPVAPRLAAGYVMQLCCALAEAHARGIVHRDIKPSNLLVSESFDGRPLVRVVDFGIAKLDEASLELTESRSFLGSPQYVSPEQIRNPRDAGASADVWGAGIVLYELLTARLPFEAYTLAAAIAAVLTDPPVPPSERVEGLDPALERVILKCLARDPRERWASMVELAEALVPFAGDDGAALATVAARAGDHAAKLAAEAPPIDEGIDISPAAMTTESARATVTQTTLAAPAASVDRDSGRRTTIALAVALAITMGAGVGFFARGTPASSMAPPLPTPATPSVQPPKSDPPARADDPVPPPPSAAPASPDPSTGAARPGPAKRRRDDPYGGRQ